MTISITIKNATLSMNDTVSLYASQYNSVECRYGVSLCWVSRFLLLSWVSFRSLAKKKFVKYSRLDLVMDHVRLGTSAPTFYITTLWKMAFSLRLLHGQITVLLWVHLHAVLLSKILTFVVLRTVILSNVGAPRIQPGASVFFCPWFTDFHAKPDCLSD